MVSYNSYIIERYNPLYNPTYQVFFHCSCVNSLTSATASPTAELNGASVASGGAWKLTTERHALERWTNRQLATNKIHPEN